MNRTGSNICVGESVERTNLLLVQGWDTNWRKKAYRATFQGQIKRLKSFV